jgi:hypothetical protein
LVFVLMTETLSAPGFTTQTSRPFADIVIGLEYVADENRRLPRWRRERLVRGDSLLAV